MPNDFQEACERARVRAGREAWNTMSPRAQSDAIYAELWEVDQERLTDSQLTGVANVN